MTKEILKNFFFPFLKWRLSEEKVNFYLRKTADFVFLKKTTKLKNLSRNLYIFIFKKKKRELTKLKANRFSSFRVIVVTDLKKMHFGEK